MSKYIKVALFLSSAFYSRIYPFCLILDQLQRSPLIIAFTNFQFREYDDNNTEEETLVAFGLAANLTRSDDNEWSEPC